jgi:type IV pilus assembly protein PilC
METYAYRVRDRSGQLREGSLEAASTALVANKLREMGYVPISIDKQSVRGVRRELRVPGFGERVKLRDIAVFSRQFATLINAGLPLLRSLQILSAQTENKVLATVVGQVRQDIEGGASLSRALARHPKQFNRLYVAMVRAGETAGILDRVLQQVADTIEKQVALRQKIRSAMTYPIAVLGLVLMILTAMLLFVVPMFKGLYKNLGGKLPLPTAVLIKASGLFVKLVPVIIVVGIGSVIGFKRWIASDKGRAIWDSIKLRIPVFGKLVHKTALVRFSRTLSVLLRSGVPIVESL